MKRIYIALFTVATLIFACKKNNNDSDDTKVESNENGYVLKGKVDNLSEGTVVLNQLIGQNIIKKDSAQISSDGTFEFKGNTAVPDFYQLLFKNGTYMVFILDNKELEFVADANNFEATKKINGSTDTDALVAMTKEVNARSTVRQALNMKAMEAQQQGNEELMQQLTAEFEASEHNSIENIKRVIAANTHSFIAAIGALNFIDPSTDFQFLDSISNVLNKNVPESRYTKDLFQKVNGMRNVAVGSMAPEINLPSPSGENLALSSLRGKYVLLDFWASWCRPCRAENPNVVKLYAKYKGPKFEIYGVSLDQPGSKEKWVNAIEKDGITWLQVSDLLGWSSSAAGSYQVQSIPATFLIDPDGKIIAKNLRGPALEEKLKEILG